MPRIEQLEKLLAAEPSDVFLNFALALELAKLGRTADALAQFDKLIQLNPNYPPAYFQKGRTLLDAGDHDAARRALQLGVERARAVGDQHAADEMSDLLAAMG